MSNEHIRSKAGLIGYLEGNFKGIVWMLKGIERERKLTMLENSILNTIESTLKESEEMWERVKTEE